MNVLELMGILAARRTDQPVLVSPGVSGSALKQQGHRDPTLYNLSLAYAAPTAFGLALARPDLKVIAVEGDGSLLAGLGGLSTVSRYAPPNLILLVVDNGTYLSTDRGELE